MHLEFYLEPYRRFARHMIGGVLSRRNAVPVLIMFGVVAIFLSVLPKLFALGNLADMCSQLAEFGLVVLGMTIVVLAGGIDLSVGSIWALSIINTLCCMNIYGTPVGGALVATMGLGVVCGAINGLMIGYLRLRAFLTTLVTLVIYRSIYDMIFPGLGLRIISGFPDSSFWDFLGMGELFGLRFSFIAFAVILAIWHIVISRMRLGWQLLAVGGSRRSAYNAGINVRFVVFMAYTSSGVLTGIGAFLHAARLGGVSVDSGFALEISALTAAILGGNSLGGGRGSVTSGLVGAVTVLVLTNGMIGLGVPAATASMVFGIILILAVYIDNEWIKHREKISNKVNVSPAYYELPERSYTEPGSDLAYAFSNRLGEFNIITSGEVEGPKDVILDEEDNLYCGNRFGQVIRFFAPDYRRVEVFAHIGGYPMGLSWDRDHRLLVCVAGMGLYRICREGEPTQVTGRTNRGSYLVSDDSGLRFANGLDISSDGRIFFSESTTRYDIETFPIDALESRGNGRIICYDSRTGKTRTKIRGLIFPDGICMLPDGESFFYAEGWACRISRYWFDGPNKGSVQPVITNLPGYPASISRASDGAYWVAIFGMRSPAFDLALKMPGLRQRMVRQVPPDNWLYPNINAGMVVKFTEAGEVVESLFDPSRVNQAMITSIREQRGYLYIVGILNNRIGRLKLHDADPAWTCYASYWDK